MNPAASPLTPRPRAWLAALGTVAALGLGACSRSTNPAQSLTAPVPKAIEPAAAAPAAPDLVAPSQGATGMPTSVALFWIASDGATSYQVQVSTSPLFSTRILDRSGILGTSTLVTTLKLGTTYFWRARARVGGLNGAFSAPSSFATAGDPCVSMKGLGGSMSVTAAAVPQFRANRLRIELTGDIGTGTINAMGPCTTRTPPPVSFISGTGDVHISGSGRSGTTTGAALSFGALLPVPGEAGVVLASDTLGNVLEVIWPALAGAPPGPPILRLQLAVYSAAVQTGVSLDVDLMIVARAPDGTTATFTAHGSRIAVPPREPATAPPGKRRAG